ncbi:hypothetical protein LTR70_003906 [Exophiala xenobiotica]|uniref:Uncharacterized protein n=1 Tax=Lithohypha guttulata TaxID=1690604 RepID=A0ABR0KEV6_9EURO|nr:hypothetical protein LTR24_003404 [Lithohypha guttulata]KAK5322225.1 hypothetical protein LTR70_003906 [Exophiala xenobiotica]
MRHHTVLGAAALSTLFIQSVVAGPAMLLAAAAVTVFSLVVTGLGLGCKNADKDDVGTDRDANNCRKGKRSLEDLLMERDAELWATNLTETVKRDGGLYLPGVPQFVRDQCQTELTKATVVVTGPIGNNGIRLDGVPATCMTLATVLAGDPVNGPFPIPMGSAALQYNDLTLEQYNQFKALFTQHATA